MKCSCLLRWLCFCVSLCLVLGLSSISYVTVSRQDFLLQGSISVSSLLLSSAKKTNDVVALPLIFLPKGGCLALRIDLNDDDNMNRLFSYFAIVDTGSPFMTAPHEILPFSRDESRHYPPSKEQYGETIGNMRWQSVTNLEILANDYLPFDVPKMTVGVPDGNVMDDTGGIFLGLIDQDDYRPSVLRQWGYCSLVLDYRNKLLQLHKRSIIDAGDPEALELFQFSPFGDNIHHYGIECASLTLIRTNNRDPVTVSSMKRSVVAVIDSGLTGCVFSDSLRDELESKGFDNLHKLRGSKILLPTVSGGSLTLESDPKYWFLSSFKLPWFGDDEEHPHVIVMGATYLTKLRISLDPTVKRFKIEL